MTTSTGERLAGAPVPGTAIPPLEAGDRLTRDEFQRRYEAMPASTKAELIVEVASSSASYDLHAKLHTYRRSGVQEYVVWRILDHQLDWLALRGGRYQRLEPDERGVLRSVLFPGLWLDAPALLRGDLAGTLRVLGEGLATAEHAAFVQRLRR